jgi:signal transduction histidine kinase
LKLWPSLIKSIEIPAEFSDQYRQELSDLNLTYARIAALTSAAIFILFYLIGYERAAFPDQLRFILSVRIAIAAFGVGIYFISKLRCMQPHGSKLMSLVLLAGGLVVDLLMHHLGHAQYFRYDFGLIMVYVAAMFITDRLRYALIVCLGTFTFYSLPLLFAKGAGTDQYLGAQLTIIFMTLVVNNFQFRLRTREILNRITIQKQSRELEKQAEEIKRSEKAKRQFIGNVTHDLKTPLSIIAGNVDKLRSSIATPSTDQSRYIAAINDSIIKSAHQLDMLIGVSLLDSEEEKPSFALYEYNQYLRKISADFAPLAEKRGINFQLDIAQSRAVVSLDPSYLERIVGNLIQNAFKFTEAGGTIAIRSAIEDSVVVTEVADTGCGIPEEKIGRIFERKYQAHEDKKTLGFGLGLSIVREMIIRMGGEITVSSKVGEGATFRFSLPLTPDQTVAVSDPDDTASDTNRIHLFKRRIEQDASHQALYGDLSDYENRNPSLPTILVCEDTPGQLRLIVDCLSSSYNLLLAQNGVQGLEKLAQHGEQIRLILSDVKMPDMDGLEFCQKVFEQEQYRRIPFIFLTAYFNEPEQMKGLSLGATDYLQKPFNELILREKITHWIARREHERLLDATIESLRGRTEQLSQLRSIIEHEIRNPLQIVEYCHVSANKLKAAFFDKSDERQRRYWEKMDLLPGVSEAIQSVLNTSRTLEAETAGAEIKTQMVSTLLDEALAQTSGLLKGLTVTTEMQLDPEQTVRCDRGMITQVLVNLIRNGAEAIRDKVPQTEGRISIRAAVDPENHLAIAISDNGVGIDNEAAGKLFKYRHTTKADGTGIGLYLSRKILKLHGGEIKLRSQPGEGSTFTVLLPLKG